MNAAFWFALASTSRMLPDDSQPYVVLANAALIGVVALAIALLCFIVLLALVHG